MNIKEFEFCIKLMEHHINIDHDMTYYPISWFIELWDRPSYPAEDALFVSNLSREFKQDALDYARQISTEQDLRLLNEHSCFEDVPIKLLVQHCANKVIDKLPQYYKSMQQSGIL